MSVFVNFWYPSGKKFQAAADRTILTPAGFPIAHLKAFAPRFSGNMSKMSVLLKLGVPAPSKVSWSSFVSLKKPVLEAVFWRKSSFWLTSTKGRPPLNIHRWKAMDLSFLMVFLKKYFFHPAGRQNFGNASGKLSSQYLTYIYKYIRRTLRSGIQFSAEALPKIWRTTGSTLLGGG